MGPISFSSHSSSFVNTEWNFLFRTSHIALSDSYISPSTLNLCSLFFTFIFLLMCAYRIFGSFSLFSTIPFSNFLASSLLILVYSFLANMNLLRAALVLCLFHLLHIRSFFFFACLHLSLNQSGIFRLNSFSLGMHFIAPSVYSSRNLPYCLFMSSISLSSFSSSDLTRQENHLGTVFP